nr:uncharacterized protein LOC123757059 [Procambarus clarkii]
MLKELGVSRSALSSQGSTPLPLFSRTPPPPPSSSPAPSSIVNPSSTISESPPTPSEPSPAIVESYPTLSETPSDLSGASPALSRASELVSSADFVDVATSTSLRSSALETAQSLFHSSFPPYPSTFTSSSISHEESTFAPSHKSVANITAFQDLRVTPLGTTSVLPSTSAAFPSPSLLPHTSSWPSPSPGPSSSSPAPPSASVLSSPTSPGVCWGGEAGGSIALSPDHRGNLWLLTSYKRGPQVSPGLVWVLNFTSLTWQALGQHSNQAQPGGEDRGPQNTMERHSQPTTPLPAAAGDNVGQVMSGDKATVTDPLAFCPWSHGLVALYSANRSSTITWLLPYGNDTWRRLHKDQGVVFPSGAASVIASWCGRHRDALWLLTTARRSAAAVGKSDSIDRQTLWKLDHRGKWSALNLVPGREEKQFDLHRTIRSWSDDRGALFLLQELESLRTSLRLVKLNTVSGTRTLLTLQADHESTVWVPSSSGELYSIFSDPRGSWIVTFSYYTGVVLRRERTRVALHTDNLLVKMNETIYNNIPLCGDTPYITSEDVVAKEINLYHISLSPECPQFATQHTTTLQHRNTQVTKTFRGTNTPTHQFPNIQAIVGEDRGSGGGSGVVSTSTLPAGETNRSLHNGYEGNYIFITDGKNESEAPPGPHLRGKNHANNSIIFFSLSLSIFALVGIIIFVRRCVRCPAAHELGDVRDERGKPPSPIPVLYSIVSEDPNYETSTNNSPCPSQNALYDATVTTAADTPSITTPNGGTPNYMTPSSTTPTGMSPSTVTRHTLTPASHPRDPVSYAITNTTTDAISIATNNAFTKYLINSASDPISLDGSSTLNTTSTSTTQF